MTIISTPGTLMWAPPFRLTISSKSPSLGTTV
jgi:hypothetical protein